MCNCATHARDFSELQGSNIPASLHAPTCEDYVTEKFTRVAFDGTSCIMEPHEAASMIEHAEDEYRVEMVLLTRDQFDRLPEFQGF